MGISLNKSEECFYLMMHSSQYGFSYLFWNLTLTHSVLPTGHLAEPLVHDVHVDPRMMWRDCLHSAGVCWDWGSVLVYNLDAMMTA